MRTNFEIILQEASDLELEIDVLHEEKQIASLKKNGREILIQELFCVKSDQFSEGVKFAKDKWITRLFWQRNNIPNPQTVPFQNKQDAISKLEKTDISYPVVIKERKGSRSTNVHTNISSREDLKSRLDEFPDGGLMQEMVHGTEYRVLVYRDKVLGVLEMIPPYVTGNGKQSIQELIQKKNIENQNKIIINEKVLLTLKRQRMDEHYVVPPNVRVFLQENSRLAEGGTTADRTDEIHPELQRLAIRSVRSVKLDLGGVDVICDDIARNPNEQNVAFLEVNGHPSLNIHHEPNQGKSQNVTKEILRDIFDIQ